MASANTNDSQETYRPAYEGSKTFVSYGLPFPEACKKHAAETFKASKIYITASGSLSRNTDHVRRLEDALGEKVVGTRHGMKPHTLWSEVLEVTQEASQAGVDLLVTLGAGSLTDAAKIVALAIANNAKTFEDLDALHDDSANSKSDLKAPTIPIICIPTSLSGGEYNYRAGGSNDHNHRKYSFAHPAQRPALVILDPELTTTTPDRWWLSTGVRAIDHCVEAMCALDSKPECDVDRSESLKLLVPGLLRCKKSSQDLEARFNCQLGVIQSTISYGVPMGASHGIGHQLGPMGVGHGETSCILLPAVCKYNQSVNAAQQQKVKDVLWSEPEASKVLKNAGLGMKADLGDMLDVIFRFLGMPRTLKEFDIGEDQFDALAKNSLHDRHLPTNPRPITEQAQVLEILNMVKG